MENTFEEYAPRKQGEDPRSVEGEERKTIVDQQGRQHKRVEAPVLLEKYNQAERDDQPMDIEERRQGHRQV